MIEKDKNMLKESPNSNLWGEYFYDLIKTIYINDCKFKYVLYIINRHIYHVLCIYRIVLFSKLLTLVYSFSDTFQKPVYLLCI